MHSERMRGGAEKEGAEENGKKKKE